MVIKYVFRALLFIGITSEIVIFVSANIFSVSVSQWLPLPLLVIFFAFMLLFFGMIVEWKEARSWPIALTNSAEIFGVPRKPLAMLVSEIYSFTSVLHIFRVSDSKAKADSYPGYKNLRTIVFFILGLVIVEMVVVHFALRNDFWRYLFLALSLYSTLLLVGFYNSMKYNAHDVTGSGVIVRHGKRFICEIPWQNISAIKNISPGQGGNLVVNDQGEARIPVLSEVNVRIELEPPVQAEDLYFGIVDICAVEIYCDEGEKFVDEVSAYKKVTGRT
jgi:hypothetical protein